MAVTEYGTIGIRPRGEWDPDTKYDLLNLVTHDGSSYVAHTDPPAGTLPTNTDYWQASANGTGKATADSVGTVKPDRTTTEVSADGALSTKQATQTTAGIVKGSNGIKVGEGGNIDVNTEFTQATELANLIAGEAIASVLGKISKAIAVTMNLDQNALLKNMLTSIDVNDSNKVPTSAFIHTLVERIGMGTELTAGDNLSAAFNQLNSNLTYELVSETNDEYNSSKLIKDKASGLHIYQYTRKILVNNTSVVSTIPSGHYPTADTYSKALCIHETSGIGTGQLTVKTNGQVVLGSNEFDEKLRGTFTAIW